MAPEWSRFRAVLTAASLGYVMGTEDGARVLSARLQKWAERASRIGARDPPAGMAAVLCPPATSAVGYIAHLRQPPAAGDEMQRWAVSRALNLLGMGRPWHLALAVAGGARFSSALAYAYRGMCDRRTAPESLALARR